MISIHKNTPALRHTVCRFFNESSSTSNDNRTGASEEALAVGAGGAGAREDGQAGVHSNIAKDDGVAISSSGSNIITGDATAVGTGAYQSNISLGHQVQASSGGHIGDVTVGYDAASFQNALQTVGSNLSQAINSQANTNNAQLDSVLGRLASLAESKQTDGESAVNKNVLWIALAAVAAFAWILSRR